MMRSRSEYCVELEKEALIFSAAHFITFGDDVCESLHGHNYRVRCRVCGPLNRHGYVVDFVALRDELQRLIKVLDHHVLLPTNHPRIKTSEQDGEVSVRFAEKRWMFPADNCVLIPVDNTTAERLAEFLADQLRQWLVAQDIPFTRLTLGVDENEGQWGEICLFADVSDGC
ncbi:MAG TPA: 6-pyruvoyl tetrahydropterin synthase family protein [Pirellulaceae bacterium]|nr:6-pyruvoyl tetrahydropterin synthase family protein [Pirellulaceae bacterium]